MKRERSIIVLDVSIMFICLTTEPPTLEHLKKGPLIGRGAFGSVYKCTDERTGLEIAMKEVLLGPKEVATLENEIKTFGDMTNHPRLVRYLGYERHADSFCIYLEYVAEGSIEDQLKDDPLAEMVVRRYTRQILEGLCHLHANKIIHRDIKAANILRDKNDNVKLTDFGLSKRLRTNVTHAGKGRTASGGSAGAKSFCGTTYWMAPEVIRGETYAYAADIWSVGATVVEMLTGNPPNHELESHAALFKIGNTSEVKYSLPPPVSRATNKFLKMTFTAKSVNRPSADDLSRHEFVNLPDH